MCLDQEKKWLQAIEEYFEGEGSDFYYLLDAMVKNSKIDFCDLLSNAAMGHGCTVYEGLMYSLDQDWDIPEEFSGVSFFVGDVESSVLSVEKYLSLINFAALKYLDLFPDRQDRVINSLSHVENRYGGRK